MGASKVFGISTDQVIKTKSEIVHWIKSSAGNYIQPTKDATEYIITPELVKNARLGYGETPPYYLPTIYGNIRVTQEIIEKHGLENIKFIVPKETNVLFGELSINGKAWIANEMGVKITNFPNDMKMISTIEAFPGSPMGMSSNEIIATAEKMTMQSASGIDVGMFILFFFGGSFLCLCCCGMCIVKAKTEELQ